jgi:Dolichyl-phosphate-mannose-protein mannosyltransferase
MKTKGLVRTYSSPFEWDYLEKSSDTLLICIPIILLLVLTIPYTARGFWEDEIFSITTSRTWAGMLGVFRNYENNMSLYYMALYVWMKVFGEGEIATRSLSLLFAALTIPVFFKLERSWLNKSTALVGGLLLAANPLFVYYAVEARSYSFLVLSATASTWIFIRLMRKPGYFLAFCYGFSITAGIYIHYFGILLPLVHALTISWKRLTRLQIRSFLLSGLLLLTGLIPLVLFPPRNKNQIDWISRPDPIYLWLTIKDLFGGGLVFLALIFCLFFVWKKRYWKNNAGEGYSISRLSIMWAIVPACLLFLFSWMAKPVFLTRFFVWCLPGAVLLTCVIVGYTGWNHIRKSVFWLLLLVILVIRSNGVLRTKGSGYKEAVKYLNEQIQPGETVLTYPYYKSIHTGFYLDKLAAPKPFARPLVITTLPYLPGGGGRDPDPDMETLKKLVAFNGKVYLLCRGDSNYITDSIQNRAWLPEIERVIFSRHPKQHDSVFGVGTEQPIRIIIYE